MAPNFRVMGYIYTGLCWAASILLIINTSNTVKPSGYYGEKTSVVSIIILFGSLISLIFNALLTFGLLMHRVQFIKYHLRFVSTIYALCIIGLFIGCILGGIVIGNNGEMDVNGIGAAVTVMSWIVISAITFVTLEYALIAWILKGVMRVISNKRMTVSDNANEMT
ncbi:uncharacterized protein LOC110679293 [Aedes aegypti]|uniref:Uncharacterized protein n=1 Tax=Aedes aegypti TaxID=7159 RepID=A0A6I8TYT5_AEDAE|nr:uncharacterized protein LOC110679293 [Aedes aegypti]